VLPSALDTGDVPPWWSVARRRTREEIALAMARQIDDSDVVDKFADDDYPLFHLSAPSDDGTAIARELYRAYPGEYLMLHVGETDPTSGLTPVRVISHDKLGFKNERMVWEYRRRHPDTSLQLLCTSMGVGRPGGW
jgi:hypothetical protein